MLPPPPPVTEKLAAQPADGARQIVPASEPMGTDRLGPVESGGGNGEKVGVAVAAGVPLALAPSESVAVGVAVGAGVGEHSVM